MTEYLYDNWNPVTRRGTTIEIDSETGLPLIVQTQDLRPIIEANKRQASSFDKHQARSQPDGITHVARIPMVIWQQLQKLGITKDQKALNAWLDERDNRVFRTDDGRRI
jgi:hypothetical protein